MALMHVHINCPFDNSVVCGLIIGVSGEAYGLILLIIRLRGGGGGGGGGHSTQNRS